MVSRKAVIFVMAWALSLVVVRLWAQGGGVIDAQTGRLLKPGEPVGQVITSPNIGFQRVAGPPDPTGSISGRLVVRVDGVWRVATFPVTNTLVN